MTNDDTTTKPESREETQAMRAERVFETAIRVLEDSCQTLSKTPDTGEGEVTKAVRQVNGALLLTIDLQEKARAAGSKRFGDFSGEKLDLDAARTEIGLRLACLRDSRAGAGVSERSG